MPLYLELRYFRSLAVFNRLPVKLCLGDAEHGEGEWIYDLLGQWC